jgi:hypothetical protein
MVSVDMLAMIILPIAKKDKNIYLPTKYVILIFLVLIFFLDSICSEF